MHSRLVSKGAAADVGFRFVQHQIGDLRDSPGRRGQQLQVFLRDTPDASFQLQIGHDRRQIGVAAPFPKA